MHDFPSRAEIEATQAELRPYVLETPSHTWRGREIEARLAKGTTPVLKLELFQRSGTFKARGALANMLRLSDEERRRGVTAVSAGNHAIAVAYAAAALGIDAKVVMQSSANAARVAAARAFGADVIIGGDGPACFALVEKIAKDEGRTFIHPFDGKNVARGTGTLGLEFARQAGELDALIIAIGGGGLAGGVSTAFRALQPKCEIYGVEPKRADTMHRSFAAGSAQRIDKVSTIADSLGPPMALPYGYELCKANLDDLVLVDDEQICDAMALMFREMKLAVEPAGAAGMAALLGPLRERLAGKRVGVIVCGANIDIDGFATFVKRGLDVQARQ